MSQTTETIESWADAMAELLLSLPVEQKAARQADPNKKTANPDSVQGSRF